jgi:Uma2 family endonuclease
MSVAIRSYCWTRQAYEQMIDCGLFPQNAHIQLIDGEILEMSPQKSHHAATVCLLEISLSKCFAANYHIRSQLPIIMDNASEPESDIAIVNGTPRDYIHQHPKSAVLIVEVSDTTLSFERGKKLKVYARNGINDYWILNLQDKCLEVYRQPYQEAYADRQIYYATDSVQPLGSDYALKVKDLLP